MSNKTSIATVMTPLPYTIGSRLTADKAFEMMKEFQVRHIPVQERGVLVGLISELDIRVAQTIGDLKTLRIDELMSSEPYAVEMNQPLQEVCNEMAKHKYGSAVVINQAGEAIGIFTAIDALKLLANKLG